MVSELTSIEAVPEYFSIMKVIHLPRVCFCIYLYMFINGRDRLIPGHSVLQESLWHAVRDGKAKLLPPLNQVCLLIFFFIYLIVSLFLFIHLIVFQG